MSRKIDFNQYTIKNYLADIDKYGMEKTWNNILQQVLEAKITNTLFCVENFGQIYEIGLEHENKISKKEMGKYYTPKDVAKIMSEWLEKQEATNVCDIGCGTGNLILSYLATIGKEKTRELINNGNVYLYDKDKIALKICKYSIAIIYGKDLLSRINTKCCDFLSKKTKLPKECKIICNPPYHSIKEIDDEWEKTKVINESKELYSSFMEKIIKNSKSSVIITPYSFIGCQKFYSLRKFMNEYNGFIVSFDNVPGNIFSGKKHGIFNSNNSNSVRAAITVVENRKDVKGFRLTPLIRFKTEEREDLLNCEVLESLLSPRYQIVDNKNKSYYKCFKELEGVLQKWKGQSSTELSKYISDEKNNLPLYIPDTCRYFTVAAVKDLDRTGKKTIYIKDKEFFDYTYCLMNSTFAYWHWRLYDGGINCPLNIINTIPVFYDKLSKEDKENIHNIAKKMISEESNYLVYKKNADKLQENIKFPKHYRDEINSIFLNALGVEEKQKLLDRVHSSSIFMK